MIHRSPNHTRGRTPWLRSSTVRTSQDCSNSGIRVSAHSRDRSRNGEFAPTASCTPARHCAAFQYPANASGCTCRCSCIDVHAASGAIESKSAKR